MQLISEALQRGEQVSDMLPEIALTAQIVRRLQHCFGGQVGLYHSKFSPQERAELWQKWPPGSLLSCSELVPLFFAVQTTGIDSYRRGA
jgi:primosomal protein N' (replication factor Y)